MVPLWDWPALSVAWRLAHAHALHGAPAWAALAASSIAALRFASAQSGIITDTISIALLALLATLVIAALLGRTVFGVFNGELRTLSS